MNPHTKKSTPTYIGNPHIILGWRNPHTNLGMQTLCIRTTPSHFANVAVTYLFPLQNCAVICVYPPNTTVFKWQGIVYKGREKGPPQAKI